MNKSMVRANSVGMMSTSSEELSEDKAEQELQNLYRKCRLMEGDRKTYVEETRTLLQKQRKTLDILHSENSSLEEELKLIEARNNYISKTERDLRREISEQKEMYNKGIKASIQRDQQLETVIRELEEKIAKQRVEMGGVNASSESERFIQRQIRNLENRLEKALTKFNESLTENRGLRSVIDGIRRERAVFDITYKRMEKELLEQKKTMSDLIETSNSAYEARDEAQARILALKEKAEKENQAYQQEIKELNRIIEQGRKLKMFMSVKTTERHHVNGKTVADSSKKGDNNWSRDSLEATSEALAQYEQAFERIKEVTGISDIQQLVETFTKVEDKNFSLFNYVNLLNNEAEKLADEIRKVKEQIENQDRDLHHKEAEIRARLEVIEKQLAEVNVKREHFDKANKIIEDGLDEARRIIQQLFFSIKCPTNGITDLLGASEVTVTNLMSYLIGIEQRTSDLLSLEINLQHHLLQKKKAEEERREKEGLEETESKEGQESDIPKLNTINTLIGNGPAVPPSAGLVSVVGPSTGDEENDSSEGEDRPLDTDEIRAKATRMLQKREKSASNGNVAAKSPPHRVQAKR